jgi:2-polyprenyl-6-hydroxyphenyl methylase / 3-demethylubiquinone-9 3-methyltransferase
MNATADPREIDQFERFAGGWWEPDGDFRTLHTINPVRLAFVARQAELDGARVLDVGCGGGIFSEALAMAGARVTGVDLSQGAIDAAQAHASSSALSIDYQVRAVDDLARSQPATFDVVCCMEMLEHVPEPELILAACATLLKPNGWLFASTVNRTPKAFALAIVAAEYVLKLLPRGTHRYDRFIRPSELEAGLRQVGFTLRSLRGLRYEPFTRRASESDDVSLNYLVGAQLAG